MSDKIKSEYNKYADEIKPSEEFTSRLTKTLEEETAKKNIRGSAILSRLQ